MKQFETKAKELLAQMTLEEKAGLCSGSNFWQTKGMERLGVNKVMVTDGPHGLRKQAGSSDHLGINHSVPATCFPTAATTACSFDTGLLHEMGMALAEECLQEDVAVLLGPGANIKRSPLCGRNFEYFSEDPYLTGTMASALIGGIQSKGVGTSMKHYAANNQETRRMTVNAVIDERALREIYLTGYEMTVKKMQPWTLMCCYNQVNGEFGSQNKTILTDILRTEWGFKGAVMTDWGAIVDKVRGLSAGLDLEMPYVGPANDEVVVKSVHDGSLPEADLDTAVTRILCLLLAAAEGKKTGYNYDAEAHHQLARKVAAQSSVLLKNNGSLLPLKKEAKLAVVGAFAKTPRYQGAGSSRINPIKLCNLCEVLDRRGVAYTYAPGYDLKQDAPDSRMICEAVAAAKVADVAVVCIGLPDSYESEGFDREHMRLPESHVALLVAVAKENENTVVLLFGGSAIEMPWLDSAKALLLLYLGGEAGAQAAADLLYGDANPCGKLAESFPHKLEDNSSYGNFPGGSKTVEYRESIYIGYRYYDKAGVDVLFPFGYGLSYTSFSYSGLSLSNTNNGIIATVAVGNTGSVAGAEVVQFYVSQKCPSVFKPVRELKGFSKVALGPGEEATVSVVLDERAFSYYDVDKKNWCVEAGEYSVAAAASSRDIRCEALITLGGDAPKVALAPAEFENPTAPFIVPSASFEVLYGKPLPLANSLQYETFTENSTLGEIAETKVGAIFLEQLRQQMEEFLRDNTSGDENMGNIFQRIASEMPLRSLAMLSEGAMEPLQIAGLVAAMNAEKQAQ